MTTPGTLTARRFAGWMLVIALGACALRLTFPTADPPWATTVGIVWHDEGAWVHNARNKALFGRWSEDAWNPMYIAPVFTGLEYVSFAFFGVGVWQARLVSELTGAASVMPSRLRRTADRRPRRPADRRRTARDQLRVRDVEPRGTHGSAR